VTSRTKASAAALLWIVMGFIGSLGTHNIFHRFLFRHLIGFRAIRVPARWAIITYVGLALAVAIGTAFLSKKRPWIGALIAAAFAIEMWSGPVLWYMAVPDPAPVYRWIAEAKPKAIIELPMGGEIEYSYMLNATAHHRPMLNGVSGFSPPQFVHLAAASRREPIPDRFLDELRRADCELIVLHGDLASATLRQWIANEIASTTQFAVLKSRSVRFMVRGGLAGLS